MEAYDGTTPLVVLWSGSCGEGLKEGFRAVLRRVNGPGRL